MAMDVRMIRAHARAKARFLVKIRDMVVFALMFWWCLLVDDGRWFDEEVDDYGTGDGAKADMQ